MDAITQAAELAASSATTIGSTVVDATIASAEMGTAAVSSAGGLLSASVDAIGGFVSRNKATLAITAGVALVGTASYYGYKLYLKKKIIKKIEKAIDEEIEKHVKDLDEENENKK